MKITLITGNSLRHFYFVDKILKLNCDFSWIIENDENQIPKINIQDRYLKNLFNTHFEKRLISEEKFFTNKAGEKAKSKINSILNIHPSDLLTEKFKKFVKQEKSDILISYGCHFIPDSVLNIFKRYKWNIHGGLSPKYNGMATHFWPTYLLEPEYTGMTLHELSKNIDKGNIIHQSSANINASDGLHDNACRTVKNFSDSLPKLLKEKIGNNFKLKGIPQKKIFLINWTKSMWNPHLLKVIYDLFEDKINKYCLENREIKKPKLVTILK
jgi:folate-dependent phosphoribosylglycinamide formyltransferase PurN